MGPSAGRALRGADFPGFGRRHVAASADSARPAYRTLGGLFTHASPRLHHVEPAHRLFRILPHASPIWRHACAAAPRRRARSSFIGAGSRRPLEDARVAWRRHSRVLVGVMPLENFSRF